MQRDFPKMVGSMDQMVNFSEESIQNPLIFEVFEDESAASNMISRSIFYSTLYTSLSLETDNFNALQLH